MGETQFIPPNMQATCGVCKSNIEAVETNFELQEFIDGAGNIFSTHQSHVFYTVYPCCHTSDDVAGEATFLWQVKAKTPPVVQPTWAERMVPVLKQDEYWIDKDGARWDLWEMDDKHRLNVLNMLQQAAPKLHKAMQKAKANQGAVGPTNSPQDWIRGTKLVKRLRQMRDESMQEHDHTVSKPKWQWKDSNGDIILGSGFNYEPLIPESSWATAPADQILQDMLAWKDQIAPSDDKPTILVEGFSLSQSATLQDMLYSGHINIEVIPSEYVEEDKAYIVTPPTKDWVGDFNEACDNMYDAAAKAQESMILYGEAYLALKPGMLVTLNDQGKVVPYDTNSTHPPLGHVHKLVGNNLVEVQTEGIFSAPYGTYKLFDLQGDPPLVQQPTEDELHAMLTQALED